MRMQVKITCAWRKSVGCLNDGGGQERVIVMGWGGARHRRRMVIERLWLGDVSHLCSMFECMPYVCWTNAFECGWDNRLNSAAQLYCYAHCTSIVRAAYLKAQVGPYVFESQCNWQKHSRYKMMNLRCATNSTFMLKYLIVGITTMTILFAYCANYCSIVIVGFLFPANYRNQQFGNQQFRKKLHHFFFSQD